MFKMCMQLYAVFYVLGVVACAVCVMLCSELSSRLWYFVTVVVSFVLSALCSLGRNCVA